MNKDILKKSKHKTILKNLPIENKNNCYIFSLAKRDNKVKNRIFEIDFLRGFDIILMILLHFCYCISLSSINYLFSPPNGIHLNWVIEMGSLGGNIFKMIDYGDLFFFEFFFSSLFIFLSGISCSFTKSNFKRGIKLAYLSVFLTTFIEIANYFIDTGFHIYIGILHSISIGILLYALIDKYCPKFYQHYIITGIFIILAIITTYYYTTNSQTLKFFYATKNNLYSPNNFDSPRKMILLFFGLARAGDDYFSPINTTAVLFLGSLVGKSLYKNKKSIFNINKNPTWAKPILYIGQKSLYVYIIHMPICYIILAAILLPFGYTLNL